MLPIERAAEALGLPPEHVETHGPDRAKVALDAAAGGPGQRGRYVLVTATTPAAGGEGKTVTTIALAAALARQGRRAVATIRQSALGPTLGLKGGGAGGGAARLEPLSTALLGLAGELAAVELANNLLAAATDDAIQRGRVDLDPTAVTWRRVVDVNDRGLRHTVTGMGGRVDGPLRETGFDVTPASEVMAVLTLATDVHDLRERLGATVVGFSRDGRPVTADAIGAGGAMAALLADALRPNLLRTSEGDPVLVHAGPFGNLSVGVSSVIADQVALGHAEYTVTEAGFGADLGAEKFLHLKTPLTGAVPDVIVLVTTVPSLRAHGGGAPTVPDTAAVEAGAANLRRHLRNLRRFGIPVVVALNRFPGDDPAEVAVVHAVADEHHTPAVEHTGYAHGGAGTVELAAAVEAAAQQPAALRRLYEPADGARVAVEALATRLYGADGVDWSPAAERTLTQLEDAGFGRLPICVAKTHRSLSHDPALLGAPTGYRFPVREVRLAAGAGYLTLLAGDILTMPGLPEAPRFRDLDVKADGEVVGLV